MCARVKPRLYPQLSALAATIGAARPRIPMSVIFIPCLFISCTRRERELSNSREKKSEKYIESEGKREKNTIKSSFLLQIQTIQEEYEGHFI